MSCDYIDSTDFIEFLGAPSAPQWRDFREHYPTCLMCSREVAELSRVAMLVNEHGDANAARHPDDETLLALARCPDSLAQATRAEVEAHVAACRECGGTLAMLERYAVSDIAGTPGETGNLPTGRSSEGEPNLISLSARLRSIVAEPNQWRRPLAIAAMLSLVVLGTLAIRNAWLTAPPNDTRVAEQAESPTGPKQESPDLVAAEDGLQAATGTGPALDTKTLPPPPSAEPSADTTLGSTPESAEVLLAWSSLDTPHYGPPDPVIALERTVAYRAVEQPPVTPTVLAPEHVAHTISPSPSLFWFAPEQIDRNVEILLVQERAATPLLKMQINGPIPRGIHRVSLEDLGVHLESEITYRWFVTIWLNGGADRLRSAGAVRRVTPSTTLSNSLADAAELETGHTLAKAGIWYDALDFFSQQLDAHPSDPSLLGHRSALLEQIGVVVSDP